MQKSRLGNVITMVLSGFSISFIFLCGCGAVPTVRIFDVDRDTVVEAVCEATCRRWSPSDFSKRSTVTKKYTHGHDCVFITHYRDRITVKSEKSGSTLVSVKCEDKDRFVLNLIGLVSPFYERNPEREVLITTDFLRNMSGAARYEWVVQEHGPESFR